MTTVATLPCSATGGELQPASPGRPTSARALVANRASRPVGSMALSDHASAGARTRVGLTPAATQAQTTVVATATLAHKVVLAWDAAARAMVAKMASSPRKAMAPSDHARARRALTRV